MSKIFGIGLSRSGTTSLTEALKILGFSVVHSPTNLNQIRKRDAATDTTVADNFERLDVMFPGSKFIHTIREKESWLNSCERFWSLMQPQFDRSFLLTELHKQLYGSTTFDRANFSGAYDRHLLRVKQFFDNRSDDLLIMETEYSAGNRWTDLCQFLNRPVPVVSFPRSHGITLIEITLQRLLNHFHDPVFVSKIANTTTDFVNGLKETTNEAGAHLDPEGSTYIQELTARVSLHIGSVSRTAEILGFTPQFVNKAVLSKQIPRRRLWMRRARLFFKGS